MDAAELHDIEQAAITAAYEARLARFYPGEINAPKAFYVSLTWDDWPEGGSYGTVVHADDPTQAEAMAKIEMANSRTEGMDAESEESDPLYWLEAYADSDWHLVDCFTVADFLANHLPATVTTDYGRMERIATRAESYVIVMDDEHCNLGAVIRALYTDHRRLCRLQEEASAPRTETIWTVAYNTDAGTDADAFTSEAEADSAASEWVASYWTGDMPEMPADWREAYQILCGQPGFIDAITVTRHEVTLRDFA